MVTWGIILLLCCAVLGLILRLRAVQHSARQTQKTLEGQTEALTALKNALAEKDGILAEKEALLAEKETALAEKEAALAQYAALPRPKLYLPDPEAPYGSYTVFYNENTGIYHADRACAPYQAVPTHLYQVMDHARPCKKCAEGLLPFPTPPQPQPQAEEDQLSLFPVDS